MGSELQVLQVQVDYVGKLECGAVFDNKTVLTFTLEQGYLSRGFDMAVQSMTTVGEEAEFRIRSDYGYGVAGLSPHIPPHALLLYHVKLLRFVVVSSDVAEQQRTKLALEDLPEENTT